MACLQIARNAQKTSLQFHRNFKGSLPGNKGRTFSYETFSEGFRRELIVLEFREVYWGKAHWRTPGYSVRRYQGSHIIQEIKAQQGFEGVEVWVEGSTKLTCIEFSTVKFFRATLLLVVRNY